jgi:hypothetical protein
MNFESVGQINLQTGDLLGWNFKFPIAESPLKKGAIPYGRTISSVTVTAYNCDSTAITDLIVNTPVIDNDTVSIKMKYPEVSGEGRYKLTFYLTLDNGWTRQFDFNRVVVRNV